MVKWSVEVEVEVEVEESAHSLWIRGQYRTVCSNFTVWIIGHFRTVCSYLMVKWPEQKSLLLVYG